MYEPEQFEELWEDWASREELNYILEKKSSGAASRKYLKKGYTHFDLRFWFPEGKEAIKKILKNKLRVYHGKHKRDEWWAFSPFLKILIKTPRYKYQENYNQYDLETKIRPICFASHLDSLIYSFYAYVLTKKYENYIANHGFSECPIAYRSNLDGKSNIQFSKEVFNEIRTRKTCSAIALDIKGYFDNIDHLILKEKWTKVIGEALPEDQYKIFKSLTRYSYIAKSSILKKYNVDLKKLESLPTTLLDLVPGVQDYEKFQRLRDDRLIVTNAKPNKKTERHCGIPQGSGMSSVLSNIYLIDFDKELNEKSKMEGFYYRRYCDDILIVCDSERAEELQKYTIDKIRSEYFLEIQDRKVELTDFKANSKGVIRAFNKKKQLKLGVLITDASSEKFFYKPLQYLGFEFDGQNIFIRSSSLSRYFRKMKGRIIKTVVMAYSKRGKGDRIWMRQIFDRYTHLGKNNFLTYAYKAASSEYENSKGELKQGMNSASIKRQIGRHMNILYKTLENKNNQRYMLKLSKGKTKAKKLI